MRKFIQLDKFQYLKILTIFMGVLIVPGTSSVIRTTAFKVKVGNFHFYQKLVNPCGFDHGIVDSNPNDISAADATSFTPQFLTAMSTAVNLTLSSLENLAHSLQNETDCNGIILDSLPQAPSFEKMNELEIMNWTYKSGISLVSHLHLLILDREEAVELNEISIDNHSRDDEDFDLSTFLLCGNEPKRLPYLVDDVKVRMENILCTLVSGANFEQRASFRPVLEDLEATNIFRYTSSCSNFQARDCIVFRDSKQFLLNLSSKLQELINTRMYPTRQLFTHGHGHHELEQIVDNNI